MSHESSHCGLEKSWLFKGKSTRFSGGGTINVVNGLSINGQVFILSRDNQSEAKYTLALHKLIESLSLSETICFKEHT